jgi:hypothetical protein
MRRGALPRLRVHLKDEIAKAIEGQGVSAGLARRFAAQIARKSESGGWGDRAVWMAIGETLRQEVARLRDRTGLSDRQIETVLPKLSARQVEQFIEELAATDRRIARTIFNAALDAADPLTAGRRYLEEYCRVAGQLQTIEPKVARTVANAAFTARAPREKAIDLFSRFSEIVEAYKDVRRARPLSLHSGGARVSRKRPA